MSNGIYTAIAKAMEEIQPIAKAQKNQQQGFMYRGIDQVMNELQPILSRHRIFIYPEVLDINRTERQTSKGGTLIYSVLKIKYHFAAEDGSEVCAIVIGEGMDSGDKASNKAMAIAFKYAIIQMFCIPTEDDKDPDGHTPPESKSVNNQKQNQKPQDTAEERAAIIGAIGDIMKALNPDKLPYFSEAEKDHKRAIVKGASSVKVLQNELETLKKEFEKRKAAFKPIPFGDKPDDGFDDDIPIF